jgi:hypothetical protein
MTMRRFLIVLMIALLPLRSWAGDLMGVSMSTQMLTTASANIAAKHADAKHASADMKDCADHAGLHSAATSGDPEGTDDAHCKTCVTCQICHSVLLVDIALPTSVAPVPERLKAPSDATFVSATLADSAKPPIS